MNALKVFEFDHRQIRVMDREGDPWWVAKDVCEVLGIMNPRDAVSRLDEDEWATVGNPDGRPGQGAQELNLVNESGLYSLIFRSRKPEAKRFKRWVTHEVLPAIRKTGGYGMPAFAGAADLGVALCDFIVAEVDRQVRQAATDWADRQLDQPSPPSRQNSVEAVAAKIERLVLGAGRNGLTLGQVYRRTQRLASEVRATAIQQLIDEGKLEARVVPTKGRFATILTPASGGAGQRYFWTRN